MNPSHPNPEPEEIKGSMLSSAVTFTRDQADSHVVSCPELPDLRPTTDLWTQPRHWARTKIIKHRDERGRTGLPIPLLHLPAPWRNEPRPGSG
jgi:hypothetical protein